MTQNSIITKQKRAYVPLVVGIACIAGFGASQLVSDEVKPIPVQVEARKRDFNKERVDEVMEVKLDHAEQILAGLVTHDFKKIAKSAESLKLISLTHPKGWEKKTDDTDVYEHFRMEFMRQAARLEDEARKEHLAGAAYFQQSLIATCIACHDYIRDEGLKEE